MKTPTKVITLGNGQLGLMLGKAAKKLQISYEALSLPDAWAWIKAGAGKDVLVTFEQEHVNEELLSAIHDAGIEAFPTWDSFHLFRNKLRQKEFLKAQSIPTADFRAAPKWNENLYAFSLCSVLKAGQGGYDGNGVWMVNENGQTRSGPVKEVWGKIQSPYLEKKVPYDFELAAVVCRSKTGEMQLYPSVKSIQQDGICFKVEYEETFAQSAIAKKAGEIAKQIAEKTQYIGALAVEFFAVGDEVYVNEIAPRVHNSGHFTIDVCSGSQFENHLRAGLGMPLLSAQPSHPAALMVNLLWPDSDIEFAALFAKLTCGPSWPENVKLHWYGKSEPRPRRKMGHFTVYGNSLKECHEIADQTLASRWA